MSIVTAEFSVSSDAFALGKTLQDGEDVQIELTHFVPIEETLVPYFWAETSDPGAFETSVRADDRVASLSETVVTAIADIAAVDVTDLDPLYEQVDPDSLNSIFQPASNDTPRSGGEIRFSLSGYEVTVSGTGHIVIDAPTDE